HDDYGTYVYKTTDYGNTWKSIKGNLPFGWVHVIREDLKNKNLLFVGTEFGIYASLDGGLSWLSLKNNLPTAAVRDIAIHPRENDLIIGTHGMGVWIMDDIAPLQEMTEEVFNSDSYLFNIRPATQFLRSTTREYYSKQIYAAKNPSFGMTITSYFRTKPEERPEVFIKDSKGNTISKLKFLKREGVQRKTWNLRHIPKTKEGKEIKPSGIGFIEYPFVASGEYTIELVVKDQKLMKKGIVYPDPRFQMKEEERIIRSDKIAEVMAHSKKMGLSITATRNIRRQLKKLDEVLKEKEGTPEIVRATLKNFDEKFAKLEEEIIPKGFGYRGSIEMALRGGSLSQLVMMLGGSISGYPSVPTKTELSQLKELSEAVNALVSRFNEFMSVEIPKLNEILEEHSLKPLKAPKKVSL
ncbi:hypothetical protein LCGC14_0676130, partial [marine sediment metagenome]